MLGFHRQSHIREGIGPLKPPASPIAKCTQYYVGMGDIEISVCQLMLNKKSQFSRLLIVFFIQYKPDVEATELALAFPISLDLSNMMLAKVFNVLVPDALSLYIARVYRWGLGVASTPPPQLFLSSNYTLYMGMAEIVKILSKMHLHAKNTSN